MHKRLAHSVWGALEHNTRVNQHSDSVLLKLKSSSFIALSRRRIFLLTSLHLSLFPTECFFSMANEIGSRDVAMIFH